jgi:hypothetical protein
VFPDVLPEHPLLDRLAIPRGGFHSMRHGAASALLADGVTPAVVKKQLRQFRCSYNAWNYGHAVGDQQRDAVEQRSLRACGGKPSLSRCRLHRTTGGGQGAFFRETCKDCDPVFLDLLRLPKTTGAREMRPARNRSQTVALVNQFLHGNTVEVLAVLLNEAQHFTHALELQTVGCDAR